MERTTIYHFGFAFTPEDQLCRSFPQKDAPSSQVLNELAEGVVRRTGGRLALAFRIFFSRLQIYLKIADFLYVRHIDQNAI